MKQEIKSETSSNNKKIVVIISFMIVFQIAMLFLSVFVFIQNTALEKKLNQTAENLQTQITDNQIQIQSSINTLTDTLAQTKTDLNTQLSQVKASVSSDFSGIISDAIGSVVSIKTDVAQGSGFIISSDGLVVTNTHVLYNAHYAKVLTYDDRLIDAKLIGYDKEIDVAVLKIQGTYSYLQFGNSDDVKIGEKVIALGNPLGLSFTATEGIVSATNRPGDTDKTSYIQTDVSLNPGNSGGPLIDKQGKVIGINNFKISGSEGIGFALEADIAVDTIEKITNRTIS